MQSSQLLSCLSPNSRAHLKRQRTFILDPSPVPERVVNEVPTEEPGTKRARIDIDDESCSETETEDDAEILSILIKHQVKDEPEAEHVHGEDGQQLTPHYVVPHMIPGEIEQPAIGDPYAEILDSQIVAAGLPASARGAPLLPLAAWLVLVAVAVVAAGRAAAL